MSETPCSLIKFTGESDINKTEINKANKEGEGGQK